MQASIILPTSGRAISVGKTLTTIASQSVSPADFEILVIENGSESGTRAAIQQSSGTRPGINLRYFYDPTPGLLAGRHRGAREAHGEILVFADDDIDASREWLAAILDAFSDPDVHLVGGRNLPRFEITPPAWIEGYWYKPPYGGRACTQLSLLDLGEKPLTIDANYVWGLNFAIRRSTLFELGGFHPDMIPDYLQHFQGDGETGLTMKANESGRLALYQPSALVHHRVPALRLTIEYFQRRAFYQGVCDSFTAIRKEPSSLSVSSSTTKTATEHRSSSKPASDLTFEEVDQRVQASYLAGFGFHQEAVRQHPRLVEWVLQKDYWDYRLPDLGPNAAIRHPRLHQQA